MSITTISRLLRPLALVHIILGVYYLNRFKNRTFFTSVAVFCYVLLCTYAITANYGKIHNLFALFLLFLSFNNVVTVTTISFNQEKIQKLIEIMADITEYSKHLGVDHNCKKALRSFWNLFCFAFKCSVGLSLLLVSYVPFSCKLLMVLTHFNNAITQLNVLAFLNFCAYFYKHLKKATVAYARRSKNTSSSIVKTKLGSFCDLHLKLFKLCKASHETFYMPMLVALATKFIYLFVSPVVCYFNLMKLLTNGNHVDEFVTLIVGFLTIISAGLNILYLSDSYTYVSSKANSLAMAIVKARHHAELDDYIQECMLKFSHRKLEFAVERICSIDREMTYSAMGSIVSVLLVVIQYHQTEHIT
ncbi:hypothetical protein FQR65_LT08658 [Abscondita terminalis]|nr:hypothetical protein FQR65_LT08658 [Abscondita terminalis]